MHTMKALKGHPFANGQKAPGDEYQATDTEAKLLQALGWADSIDTRVMKPEEVAPKRRRGRPAGTGGKYTTRVSKATVTK